MNNDYLRPIDPDETPQFQVGSGPVIRDPIPFESNDPTPILCRRPGCGGTFKVWMGTSLNPWPLLLKCLKCETLHAFDVIGGKTVYGMTL